MKWRFIVLAAFSSVALFAAGWWCGSHTSSIESRHDATPQQSEPQQRDRAVAQLEGSLLEKERRLSVLQSQLNSTMRDLEEQRRIIRKHSLKKTVRSVDEMLGLFPARYPKGNWARAETVFEDCWFEAVDGLRLHGWYLRHAQPKVVILFAHGNAGNVTHRAAVAAHLHKRFDASIMLFDYRGYGRSEGTPTIEGLVRDARAAREHLAVRERVPSKDIVLMGRSLGGAVAVQLAATDGAAALVLESTFSSLQDVASKHYPKLLVNLLVADRLDSQSAISKFDGPVLISHGSSDQTIPFALGRELFDAANEPKTFVEIARGDHNDRQSDEYYDRLERFLTELSGGSR